MAILRRKSTLYPGYFSDFLTNFFSSNAIFGDDIKKFEKEFSAMVGSRYAVATSYGLHAMSIILEYYGFNKDTVLLIPGYTSNVVQLCLDELGIPYSFVDINLDRGTMCIEDLKKKITPKVKGVLVTHLLGNSCEKEIFTLLNEKDLIAIEDATHVHGASLNSKMLGTFAPAAFFSFGYAKFMTTFTGGMLITDDEKLFQFAQKDVKARPKISRKKILGKFLTAHIERVASIPIITSVVSPFIRSHTNMRVLVKIMRFITRQKMTAFHQYSNLQARFGRRQMLNLKQDLSQRKLIAERIMAETPLRYLTKKDGDVFYGLIAIVPDAKKFHDDLWKKGIDSGCQDGVMNLLSPNLPGCLKASEQYLFLPCYPSLSEAQIQKIITSITEVAAGL